MGFLTVAEHAPGYFGGYLVLNLLGRPLEFHCTTPVKPSRAQEILYGPTLASYLCGELIGQTLVMKAAHKPQLILTDLEAALSLRLHNATPMALVCSPTEGVSLRCDPPHGVPRPALVKLRHGANELAVDPLFRRDQELIQQRLQAVGETFDLAEPFERIREAIQEAQRGAP